MHIEAFSLGKRFGHPEANEDSLVVIPDAGYAVIDGVTDRSGTRYDGMLSGRFASRTVKRAIERYLLDLSEGGQYAGPVAFIEYLGASLRTAYGRLGVLGAVEADPRVRAGCTVVAALQAGDRVEIVAVGDSGIRVNGTDVLQVFKPLDDVTGLLRRETWRYFSGLGLSEAACSDHAMAMTWQGTAHQPAGSPTAAPEAVAAIEEAALAACRARLPGVPEAEIMELIREGIAHGQSNFQNVTDRALGYGGLDGFAVPARFVESRSYPVGEVDTLELFSDGYFRLGDGFGVASWEESFRMVEATDPHKIGDHFSTKGSTATALADDRTYLGVRLA